MFLIVLLCGKERGGGHEEMLKSLRMKLSDVNSRQDRLTDLLVDGVIDQPAFNLRKDNHTFEAKQLREELATIEKGRLAAEDLAEIIEYVTSLSKIYGQADPANKRQLLKNSFEKISVRSGKLVISPASWLLQLDSVSLGNASRDTIQTAIANVPNSITCS